ncbi:MAG: hypothetical protein GY941_12840 [Planctomycetes bacterium]|nr:hypothetical protein [Planctomycetota bacterium]
MIEYTFNGPFNPKRLKARTIKRRLERRLEKKTESCHNRWELIKQIAEKIANEQEKR